LPCRSLSVYRLIVHLLKGSDYRWTVYSYRCRKPTRHCRRNHLSPPASASKYCLWPLMAVLLRDRESCLDCQRESRCRRIRGRVGDFNIERIAAGRRWSAAQYGPRYSAPFRRALGAAGHCPTGVGSRPSRRRKGYRGIGRAGIAVGQRSRGCDGNSRRDRDAEGCCRLIRGRVCHLHGEASCAGRSGRRTAYYTAVESERPVGSEEPLASAHVE